MARPIPVVCYEVEVFSGTSTLQDGQQEAISATARRLRGSLIGFTYGRWIFILLMPIPLVFEIIPVNRNIYEFNIKMESIMRLEDFPTVLIQKKSLVPHISQQPAHAEKGAPRAAYIPLPPPSKEPTEILDIDKDTPDKHVPRDPRLIRLTGIHPFNVEPPLTSLYDEGFLTSPELFYVRNHGSVPEVRQADIPDWQLSVEGLVQSPLVLNLAQILTEFEQITAPITLVCAGNRRKEQNQVRKSKGFSWGAAGVSTALFTGPLISSILQRAKLLPGAKYVCMEGADKLPNGCYGTSIKLNWAMDPNKRIMLAHKMNGEPLRPDHGRPLRAVVPGQIAWRLANIEYPEDKYREVDQNLYGGKIDMSWQETCFCWCFWSLKISTTELEGSDGILVRAMDEAMNIQPRNMYWSVLGMMNNPWFCVAITKQDGYLRFEHPTQPALIPGGWMERVKRNGGDLVNGNWGAMVEGCEKPAVMEGPKIDLKKPGLNITISLENFRRHQIGPQPWFALEGEVYDGTAFLNEHPGGAQSILSAAGLDITEEFMAIHSETAKAMMSDYHIGSLDLSSQETLKNDTNESALSPSREVFLNSKFWAPSSLRSKTVVSPDSRLFTFRLSHGSQFLGLPVGNHVMLKIDDPSTGETIIRAYTPISKQDSRGTIDILVKLYPSTPNHPNGGKMTTAMDKLPLGAVVKFKGPIGKFEYLGNGEVLLNEKKRYVQSFHMICAGSGITPIFQILRAVIEDPEDRTSCVVLDGNRTEADILCRAELDDFMTENSNGKCRIVHTLTQPSSAWTGRKGRISEDLLLEYVPVNAKGNVNSLVLVCGPEALEVAVKNILLSMGWNECDLIFF
ncbi:nitrate reductase [Histoplasma capsulatum G186AR]|uniref:Nitrate reductase [NADPH] n=1 Tax=Ajellomyces capsulatus (strain G186AR / H82 / ATCC MYA-2454 / RMSCC 2432) TaxID=447093 RepID=C0NNK2_AJECG|nr:nitrate reductase [Histoplasma capsulatum G186AR]EEH06512.1 nitrate reductase [Histoplasma capsulatum G186AR]